MATKSILKQVVISDKKLASSFVNSLAEPEKTTFKRKDISRSCETIKGDSIKEFFGIK